MTTPEYMPLDADQIGLLRHVEGAPRAVLNLPTRIDLLSEIDEEKCLAAMRLTVTRLPYCTLRFHENEDGSLVQYYYKGEPEGIEVLDFTDGTDKDVDAYILKSAGSAFPNNCVDSQLYTFKLIRKPGGGRVIFFNGYHMIMDTYGVMETIIYFDKVYAALTKGTEMPAVGVGVEKHYEKSWEYKNSAKAQKDIDWWCRQFATEPHFSSINPYPSDEYIEGKNYGKTQTLAQMRAISMPRRIPADLVKRANDAALAQNLSPQLYYALALRTFLAFNSGCEDVCIATTGARRATLYQKECGLTLAHMITWRSVIAGDSTVQDALIKLDITQKDIYKHIGVDMADYMADGAKRFGTPVDGMYKSVVFTYQPYFNIENANLKFTADHVNVGLTPYPVYMNVMPRDVSGDLWADYIYGVGYFKPENLERFHAFMLKFVDIAVDHPEKTVNEIRDAIL